MFSGHAFLGQLASVALGLRAHFGRVRQFFLGFRARLGFFLQRAFGLGERNRCGLGFQLRLDARSLRILGGSFGINAFTRKFCGGAILFGLALGFGARQPVFFGGLTRLGGGARVGCHACFLLRAVELVVGQRALLRVRQTREHADLGLLVRFHPGDGNVDGACFGLCSFAGNGFTALFSFDFFVSKPRLFTLRVGLCHRRVAQAELGLFAHGDFFKQFTFDIDPLQRERSRVFFGGHARGCGQFQFMFDLEPRDGIVNCPRLNGFSLQCEGFQIFLRRQVLLRDPGTFNFGRRMFVGCIEQFAFVLDGRWRLRVSIIHRTALASISSNLVARRCTFHIFAPLSFGIFE